MYSEANGLLIRLLAFLGGIILSKVTDREAKDRLKENTRKTTEADVETVLHKRKEIEDKFSSSGPLGKYIKDLKLLFSVVQDYWGGEYRVIPWASIASIVAALTYILSPIDLIPDPIPIIGLVDDALVLAMCLAFVEGDLFEYEKWKINNA